MQRSFSQTAHRKFSPSSITGSLKGCVGYDRNSTEACCEKKPEIESDEENLIELNELPTSSRPALAEFAVAEPANPKKKRSSKSISPCAICFNERKKTVLAPCGHKTICKRCTSRIMEERKPICPICRKPIESYITKAYVI